MAETFEVPYDESALVSGPYFHEDMIVQHAGRICRVLSTRKVGSKGAASLQVIDFPTENELAEALTWRWDDDSGREAWQPLR